MSMTLKLLVFVVVLAATRGRVLDSQDEYFIENDVNDNWRSGKQLATPKAIAHHQPPPRTEYAKVARYIVHKSEWTAMGTVSTLKSIEGYPMVNIISVADSPRDAKSTGHIYFLLTDLDFTAQDLRANNKLTTLFSNDQDLECTKQNVDPMEPVCGRIMISGQINRLEEGTEAYAVANKAFVSRHPASKNWVRAHEFYLCELDIQQIAVLNYYGGPHYVTAEDYYRANFDADDEDPESVRFVDVLEGRRSIEPSVRAV